MRALWRLLFLALAVLVIGLASLSGMEAQDHVMRFSLPDASGVEVRSEDLHGRFVLLYFFSLDRTADRREARLLEEQIWRRYRELDVRVCGVGADATVPEIRRFVDASGISYPVLADTKGVARTFWSGGEALNRAAIVLLDENEGIVYRGYGYDGTAIVSELRKRSLTTEVDESTWGKIKELFR